MCVCVYVYECVVVGGCGGVNPAFRVKRAEYIQESGLTVTVVQLLSRRNGSLAMFKRERACPGVADQKQTEPEGPRADRRQEKGHEAVGLQEEVTGVGLPGEEQQHEEVNRQGPPVTARPHKVGSEAVAVVTVEQAPAEVTGEGDVEEEQLAEGKRSSSVSSQKKSKDDSCSKPEQRIQTWCNV